MLLELVEDLEEPRIDWYRLNYAIEMPKGWIPGLLFWEKETNRRITEGRHSQWEDHVTEETRLAPSSEPGTSAPVG